MRLDEILENPPKELLASYTDADGYTIEIDGRISAEEKYAAGAPRYGIMYITNPSGHKIKAGYWMAWPEKEWGITKKAWGRLRWKERAALEVKHQATAYAGLKADFDRFDRKS